MKKILIGIFTIINLTLSGATYYVATNGNDSNPGTLSSPWRTWQKAFDVAIAGDIVNIRGGIYYTAGISHGSVITGVNVVDKNGTSSKRIIIQAYQNEVPILDCSPMNAIAVRQGISFSSCSYYTIKGLTVRNVKEYGQYTDCPTATGLSIGTSNNMNFERCVINSCGNGFSTSGFCNYIDFLNCDSYDNIDFSDSGGFANGWTLTMYLSNGVYASGTHVTLTGCRAWGNSDDGFDMYGANGYFTYTDCWAFDNGRYNGNGDGFKSHPTGSIESGVQRTFVRCVAFKNKGSGFTSPPYVIENIYNCVSYDNDLNGIGYNTGDNLTCVFKNNISYKNTYSGQPNFVNTNNTWNGRVTVTDADFLSLDNTGTDGPRQSDGSLPDLGFLHLAPGSDLINAGVNVGLPYGGTAPDLGAFESDIETYEPPIPVYVSSLIANSTPSRLEITYNLTLANIVPAISAFSVNVNSVTRNVSAVAISGTKVILTLASPVVYGNVVTVAYTKPAINPLQTPSGGQAVSISAQTVSNKVNIVIVNSPPSVVVNFRPSTYSGFVGTLNATGSYDANKDKLTFTWKVPANIPVSATDGPILEFLAPVVDATKKIEFTLTVSDGKAIQTKTIPVIITPYQPELEAAKVVSVKASDFQSPYYPYNIIDGNIGTMWSAIGSDQWIILELSSPFNIQHVKLAFQQGQRRESYFDIFGSTDTVNWEPILIKSASCAFSGDLQVFDFPASKAEQEFRYVKLVGQGNSADQWNYIAEFRIFGYRHKNPLDYEEQIVKIYPNPAHELVNILIDEQAFVPDFIKIVSLTGKIIYNDKVDPEVRQLLIPIDFKQGVYIVQMGTGDITMFTQKLIVAN